MSSYCGKSPVILPVTKNSEEALKSDILDLMVALTDVWVTVRAVDAGYLEMSSFAL